MTDERKLELIEKIQSKNPSVSKEKLMYLVEHWDDTDDYRDAGTISSVEDMERIYPGFDIEKYEKYNKDKNLIRNAIRSYYDMEKVRISIGNRIVKSFDEQNGQKDSEKKEEMNDEMQKKLKIFEAEYQRITDAYVENHKTIKSIIKNNQGEDTDLNLTRIRDISDYYMIDVYVTMHQKEKQLEKVVEKYLVGIPIYDNFLVNVKGCGTLMSGIIITYLDIYKAKYKSSFIKYAGIDTYYNEDKQQVVGTTKGRIIKRKYTTKEGKEEIKNSITYQPFLKAKLMGVLADLFIKLGSDYATPYYEYKHRKQNDPRCADISPIHLNKMAKRYMMKIFLGDLFTEWKKLEGLPVPTTYEERFLGMDPHHFSPLDEYKAAHPEQFNKKD